MVSETIRAELATPADECYSERLGDYPETEIKSICSNIA